MYIYGGVRPDDGDYVFDYLYNLPDDIIEISPPQLFHSSIRNHIYWFGYMFKDSVSSKQRTDFINYIKGIGDHTISDYELTQFIELPLGELDKKISMYDLDCFVYPVSKRSKLVSKMISVIGDYTSHETKRTSFELVKKINIENQSEESLKIFSKLKGKNILVVDEIGGSSTLNEILYILDEAKQNCNIFVYTLIGNFKNK